MAKGIQASGRMSVGRFEEKFEAEFGVRIEIKIGRRLADDNATLASLRPKDFTGDKTAEFKVAGNMLVGNVKKNITEVFGVTANLYHGGRIAPDDITLSALRDGRVKKKTKQEKHSTEEEPTEQAETKSGTEQISFVDDCGDEIQVPVEEVYIPIKKSENLNGKYIVARLGIVRNDWDPDGDMGIGNEISFWSSDTPIFMDADGNPSDEARGYLSFDIFFDEDNEKRFLKSDSIVTKKSIEVELVGEPEGEYDSLRVLLSRILKERLDASDDMIEQLTYLIEDPADSINEMEIDEPEEGLYQIGEGDSLNCYDPDLAKGALFIDLVYSEEFPFYTKEGVVSFDAEIDLDDFRKQDQHLVALIPLGKKSS